MTRTRLARIGPASLVAVALGAGVCAAGCRVKLNVPPIEPAPKVALDPEGVLVEPSTLTAVREVSLAELLAPARRVFARQLVVTTFIDSLDAAAQERALAEPAVELPGALRSPEPTRAPSSNGDDATSPEAEPAAQTDQADDPDSLDRTDSPDGTEGADSRDGTEGLDGTDRPDDADNSEGSNDSPDPADTAWTEQPWPWPALPTVGEPYEPPPWIEVEDERAYRIMVFPGELRSSFDEEGAWIFELDVEVAAALARRAGRLTGVPLSCACDGEAWCGRRKRPLKRGVLRWTYTPSIDAEWRLDGTTNVDFELNDACKVWTSATDFVDLGDRIAERMVEPARAAGQGWAGWLRDVGVVRAMARDLWQELARTVPHADNDALALDLRPSALGVQRTIFRDDTLAVELQAQLRPVLRGRRDIPDRELPPPSPPIDPKPLGVVGSVSLSTRELTDPLQRVFADRTFPDRVENWLRFTRVRALGSDQSGIVAFDVVGAATGTIYFVGSFDLDADADRLHLINVQPTRATRDALSPFYDEYQTWNLDFTIVPWVDPDAVAQEVQENSSWPLRPIALELRRSIERTLAGLEIDGVSIPESLPGRRWLQFRTDEAGAHAIVQVVSQAQADPGNGEPAEPAPSEDQ